jgi:hypothetical protein
MQKSKYTGSVAYTEEVTRIISEKDVEAVTRNLGLPFEEFQAMVAVNGFALQNARKLREIQENNDVKMGKLEHQTAWTGGTSDAEMSNSALESYYAMLYAFRNLRASDTSSMFNNRVVGAGSILPYVSPEFVIASMQLNNSSKDLLAEASERFRRKGYEQAQIIPGVKLGGVLPTIVETVSKYSSIEEAAPELREKGIIFNDITGVVAYLKSMTPDKGDKGYTARAATIGGTISALEAVGQYLDIPSFAPGGQDEAARMVTQAQMIAGVQTNEALIRQELIEHVGSIYGLMRGDIIALLNSSSTGTVYTVPGTDRELRFEITVNGLPGGKKETFKGVVNNEGGTTGTHVWASGGIGIRGATQSLQKQQ